MEIYSIFFRGKWRKVDDVIWFFPIQKWKIVEIWDNSTALLERGNENRVIHGKVRVS